MNSYIKSLFGSTYMTTQVSDTIDLLNSEGFSVQLTWTEDTPSADTFIAGQYDVVTATFAAKVSTTHGDYIVISDTDDNEWAVAASTAGIQEVCDITCIAEGSVKEQTSITALAEGSVKNVTQVTTVADVSASLAGTYFKVYDASGSVGIWFSTGGVPGSAPTGAAACDRAVEVSFTEDDTAATIAGLITTAFGADAGLSVGNSDEVVTITDLAYGSRTAASDGEPSDDTGFAIETTVSGVDSALDGKYFILQDEVGSVAFWIDVDNSGTSAPSHGADRAIEITTIASEDDLATVGTAIYTAIVADSKFEAGTDNLDGSFIVQSTTYGVKSAASAGDSGFTIAEEVAGVASSLDGKYFLLQDVDGSVGFWIDVDDSGTTEPVGSSGADRSLEITTVTSTMTASQVAGVVATAINADSKFAASATDAVVTVTHADYKALTDDADGDTGFSFEVTTQGSDLGLEPTGAIWAAIPSAQKAQVDISAATDAASVAAAFEVVFDALVDVPFATDDTADNGTMLITMTDKGVCAAAVVKNADDSGVGSIGVAETTAGTASTVNVTANTITISAHGYITGLKGRLTSTGTLPAGVTTGVDYFVILVDANTIKLASSLANAQAETAIDITDQGTAGATHTFTATSIAGSVVKLQYSNDNTNWYDISSLTSNITTSSGILHNVSGAYYRYVRAHFTATAGQVGLVGYACVKEA